MNNILNLYIISTLSFDKQKPEQRLLSNFGLFKSVDEALQFIEIYKKKTKTYYQTNYNIPEEDINERIAYNISIDDISQIISNKNSYLFRTSL
jgi:hypothetical protein